MAIERMHDYLSSRSEQGETSQVKFEELYDLISHSEAVHLVRGTRLLPDPVRVGADANFHLAANVNREIVEIGKEIVETKGVMDMDTIQLRVQEQEKAPAEPTVRKVLDIDEKHHYDFCSVAKSE